MHRDIKPENVMVRADGQVKVLDFGLARATLGPGAEPASTRHVAAPAGAGTTMSRDGLVAGTPRYMAPEQLRGEPQDARADQFSWGVMAYELLSGRAPWLGDAASLSVVSAIADAEAKPLTEVDPAIPEAVARVVARAMEKSPADRFPSMDDVLLALGQKPTMPMAVDTHPSLGSAHTVRGSQATTRAAPRRRRLLVPAIAAVVIVGIAAARLASNDVHVADAPTTSGAAAASAPPKPTTILDPPLPPSEVSEARAAYAAGLQSLREGSIVHAVQSFVRAAELDPSMAAAHLRVVVYGTYTDAANPHEHFARASALRSRLSERDQAMLWAYEPWYLHDPPDAEGVARRARDIADRFPLDAEIQAVLTLQDGNVPVEESAYERVLALDPEFVLALIRLCTIRLLVGDYDGALGALDRCLAIAPASNGCLSARITLYEELGRCTEMERDARLMASTSPSTRSHDWVARALYATGAAPQAVRAALELKWAATKEAQRSATRRRDEMHLAMLRGDFAAAEAAQSQLEAAVADDPTEDAHAGEMVPHVELLLEMGRAGAAAQLASGYVKSRPAWKSAEAWSPLPEMLAVAAHGGLLSEADRAAARAAWLRQWDDIHGPLHMQSWVLGWAIPATSAADAIAALDAAPQPQASLPRVHSNQFHREGLEANGRVLLLAGRASEALPYLKRAASGCAALWAPLEHTHAELHLAQALEQVGDMAGACAAYRVVLDRWGSARPRSVSADVARARSQAICR
jgi:serine/threonine-protein kinase